MPMERVRVTRQLRTELRVARSRPPKLSQREAAERAGLSEVWWRHIESGHTDFATAGTLAAMAHAVTLTPERLRALRFGHVADLVEMREAQEDTIIPGSSMRAHLMATPELTDEQREALVAMAQALRGSGGVVP